MNASTSMLDRSPETQAWLMEHLQEVLESVPDRTPWVALSGDGRRVVVYGDDPEGVRRRAADLGEADPIVLGWPKFSAGYYA